MMVNWPSNPQEPQFLSPFSIRFPVKGHGPWDQAQVLHSQVMHRRQPYHDEATVYYFILEQRSWNPVKVALYIRYPPEKDRKGMMVFEIGRLL